MLNGYIWNYDLPTNLLQKSSCTSICMERSETTLLQNAFSHQNQEAHRAPWVCALPARCRAGTHAALYRWWESPRLVLPLCGSPLQSAELLMTKAPSLLEARPKQKGLHESQYIIKRTHLLIHFIRRPMLDLNQSQLFFFCKIFGKVGDSV